MRTGLARKSLGTSVVCVDIGKAQYCHHCRETEENPCRDAEASRKPQNGETHLWSSPCSKYFAIRSMSAKERTEKARATSSRNGVSM